jgi:hypothetical protein
MTATFTPAPVLPPFHQASLSDWGGAKISQYAAHENRSTTRLICSTL